jgi:hypothetical protein
MVNRKDRRHSGREYTVIYHPEKPENSFEEEKYNDWTNYRDGQRSPVDRSKIRPEKGISWWFLKNVHILSDNIKLKRKEVIRRIRKFKERMKNSKIL